MITIKSNLRILRHKNGWTQEYVAKRLGISILSYSKIEGGLVDLNLSRIEQIAEMYFLSAAQLFSLDEINGEQKHDDMIASVNNRILELETERTKLQRLAIELLEELKNQQPPSGDMNSQAKRYMA